MSKLNRFALLFLLLLVTSCTTPLDPLFEFKISPNLSIKTLRLDDKVGQIATQFSLQTTPLKQGDFLIIAELINEHGRTESFSRSLQHFSTGADTTFTLALTPVAMPSVWSETNPKSYTFLIKIVGQNEHILTQITRPFAFKKVRFESTGLYLNDIQMPVHFQKSTLIQPLLGKDTLYLLPENELISKEKWDELNRHFIKTLLPVSELNNPLYNTQPSLLAYYTTHMNSIPKSNAFSIQLPILFLVESPLSDTDFYNVCKQVDGVILTDPSLLSKEAQNQCIRPLFHLKASDVLK